MSLYQIQTSVNSQKINTNLECPSVDSAKSFIESVSVGEVLEIKKYIFVLDKEKYRNKKDLKVYRYAKLTLFFEDGSNTVVKIPKLKDSVSKDDLIVYFNSIYKNLLKINISITSK